MSAPSFRSRRRLSGFSLIEVLITMVILGVGLLGLAGLQARAFNAEVESFSRSQALILVNDMADRIATNRVEAKRGSTSTYNSTTTYGAPYTPTTACSLLPSTTSIELAARDMCEWSEALKGATQVSGGSKVGQLTLAQGCITWSDKTAGPPAQPQRFLVTVAWAGRSAMGAVPADLTCGSTGPSAIGSFRRAVSVTVPLADLDG